MARKDTRDRSYYSYTGGPELSLEEEKALRNWNSEVKYLTAVTVNACTVRKLALKQMGDSIGDLASCFMNLWPHWFLNGRKERALGTKEECLSVCEEIICKLGEGGNIPMYNHSGMVIAKSGKRSFAAIYKIEGKKKGYRHSPTCRFHSDRPSSIAGLCKTCYGRHTSLLRNGIELDTYPEEVMIEVMTLPKMGGRKFPPLYKMAEDIKERYINGA